mmetsp:Transcript_36706/g.121634  ORF Transcript_36706/g.121634 Transcript_36706/m.121634 type:complete len:325 (+) Transcript_36706:834-1808(+)
MPVGAPRHARRTRPLHHLAAQLLGQEAVADADPFEARGGAPAPRGHPYLEAPAPLEERVVRVGPPREPPREGGEEEGSPRGQHQPPPEWEEAARPRRGVLTPTPRRAHAHAERARDSRREERGHSLAEWRRGGHQDARAGEVVPAPEPVEQRAWLLEPSPSPVARGPAGAERRVEEDAPRVALADVCAAAVQRPRVKEQRVATAEQRDACRRALQRRCNLVVVRRVAAPRGGPLPLRVRARQEVGRPHRQVHVLQRDHARRHRNAPRVGCVRMHRLAWRSRIRHEGAELKELRAATQRRDERGPERVQKLPQRLGDGVLGQVEL